MQKNLWIDGKLNRKIIAKSAKFIAKELKLDISQDVEILMVEESGVGKDYPFSGEKLSPVLSVYKVKNFNEAKNDQNKSENKKTSNSRQKFSQRKSFKNKSKSSNRRSKFGR